MPDGAMGEDYCDIASIRSYSIANAMSWYKFINRTLGREAPNGSLYVATGCDKSAAWGIATMGEASSSQTFSLQFTAVKASIGASYSCSWSSSGGAVTRSSAPSDFGLDTVQPQNQCLFVRGFKIMVREGIKAKIFGAVGQVESIMDHSKASSLLRWRNNRPFPGATSGRGSRSTSGVGKAKGGAADGWSAERELDPLAGVRVYLFDSRRMSLNVDQQAYHPLDTLNRYLLDKVSSNFTVRLRICT